MLCNVWQYLQYIAHTILLKCENMFAMLILHALILHSGNNIEIILPNPRVHLSKRQSWTPGMHT